MVVLSLKRLRQDARQQARQQADALHRALLESDEALQRDFIALRRRKHTLELMLACVVGLVPWTVFLVVTLPDQYSSHHWNITWGGFDILLLGSMAVTAYFGWRRRQAVIPSAIATSTLLICDAWFDVSLSLGTREIWWSLGSALLVELPLAGFLLHRAHRLISLTARRAHSLLGNQDDPPSLFKMPLFGVSARKADAGEPSGD